MLLFSQHVYVHIGVPLSVNGKSCVSSVHAHIALFPLLSTGLVTFKYKITAYLKETMADRQAETDRTALSGLICYAGVFSDVLKKCVVNFRILSQKTNF